ncbi:MAG: cupin domain-containing protein [Acidimicrobiales bacterium]
MMRDEGVKVVRSQGVRSEDPENRLRSEGLTPRTWANGPGHRYGPHTHPYEKVLYCLSGSIVFHTPGGDVALGPGDRLELDPEVEHAATVGDTGVECVEAARPSPSR